MRKSTASVAWVLMTTLILGCNHQRASSVETRIQEVQPQLNAVLWQQASAEYTQLCRQTFRLAAHRLDQALSAPSWSALREQLAGNWGRMDAEGQAAQRRFEDLPPAIIVDLDETMIDNTPFQAMLIESNKDYNSEDWDRWCEAGLAKALPGALELTKYAELQGVAVFYVSNRREHLRQATRGNLVAAGFPFAENNRNLLLRADGEYAPSNKGARRRQVSQTHRVLLLIGDQLGDFLDVEGLSWQARRDLAAEHGHYWGHQWIIMPNPIYGDWESVHYNHQYRLSSQERQGRKLESLDIWHPNP